MLIVTAMPKIRLWGTADMLTKADPSLMTQKKKFNPSANNYLQNGAIQKKIDTTAFVFFEILHVYVYDVRTNKIYIK